MKYGITVQQPPAWGSRCATFGTDMSYEMSRAANQPCRRYMAPERNPRLPNSRPRALIAVACRRNRSRLRNRWPSCVRSWTFTSKPRRLRSATSCFVETFDDHGASGTTWNDDLMPNWPSRSISWPQNAAPAGPSTSCVIITQPGAPSGQNQMNGNSADAAPLEHERRRPASSASPP